MNRSSQHRYCLPSFVRAGLIAALLAGLMFATDPSAEGASPPILVLIDVHADPMFGPLPVQQQAYQDWVDATNWVLDVAEPRGAKISFLSTGQFMERVLTDPIDGHPLMRRLYASGGQLGTHSHTKMKYGPYDWRDIGYNPPPGPLLQSWNDHVGAVNAVITAALGISDPAGLEAVNCNRGSHIPSNPVERLQMMADFGFTIHEQGSDQEFYVYFKHYVMNPYRPSGAGMLVEDLGGPVVLPPTGSILGLNENHFGILQDNRIQAKQARFLLELLNWLHDAHVAHTERVWTFGWGSHCTDYMQGRPTRTEFTPMLDWLVQHFVTQPAGGQTAATFASFPEARDAYYAWETAHPGESSFSYPASQTDWNLYPYLIPAVSYLTKAWYENAMSPVDTVRWHALTASASAGGPYTVYVAYTTDGLPATVDLSGSLGAGQIAAVNPATGSAQSFPTNAVDVATIGTILIPTDKIITFLVPADLDNDEDVDANDFLTFSNCFNGSLNPPQPGCITGRADLDRDGDVDSNDFLTFSNCFNGSLNPPGCP